MVKVLFSILIFQAFAFSAEKSIVFLGDSLTEGYGVEHDSTYTSLLQKKINQDKLNWKVINSGISGSTSASGPSRSKWLLKAKEKPSIVVVVLGANDGLRGLPIDSVKKNLTETLKILKQAKIKTILGEVYVPPNYGKEYSEKFKKIYTEVAKESQVPLMPFILEKVAGKSELNLADGIHPNEKGHQVVADGVYAYIKKQLD
jgi:acyl-CoA thioesterase-1